MNKYVRKLIKKRNLYMWAVFLVVFWVLYIMNPRPVYNLQQFVDLSGVDIHELMVMDKKRADVENVTEPENYPHYFKGGKTGILLIHGFTGGPYEMLPLAEFLNGQGYSVYAARVAGHGSNPEYLHRLTYEDWYESLKYAYWTLKNTCDRIYVVGQSMGGLLAVQTAYLNGADGLILLAPAFKVKNKLAMFVPVLKKFITTTPKVGLTETEKRYYYNEFPSEGVFQMMMLARLSMNNADDINFPVAAFQSKHDMTVSYTGTIKFMDKVASSDTMLKILDGFPGVHVLSRMDEPDRTKLYNDINEWIRGLLHAQR